MNYRLVSRNLSALLLLVALAMSILLIVGFMMPAGTGHRGDSVLTGWEVSIAITLGAALGLRLFGRSARERTMLRRDAIGTVGLGWLVCSVFVSLPYLLCEPKLSFSEAYFEAVSGLTTTGATIFNDLSSVPQTILLWRSLTQWIGGMGILAMFVLVLSGLGASGKNLFMTESSAHASEVIGTTVRQTVKYLWGLYILLTILCALGLWSLEMTLFQAVNHALTTLSTGGFGTEIDSIDGFGMGVRLWLILFMLIGGVSFPLFIALLHKGRDWKILRKHEETWAFLIILVLFSSVLFADRALAGNLKGSWQSEAVDTAFMTVSITTTTGFVVGDYGTWPVLAEGLIIFLMLVGGCAGSTAGGLKVGRLLLWFKMVRIEIRRSYRPNQVSALTLNGRTVPPGTRGQLFVILTSASMVAAVASYALVGFEPDKTVDGCVSAVLTSLSNVGPAFNEFGPTENFASLSSPGMILLSFLMIVGRLEYIALLVLFSKLLWKKDRDEGCRRHKV